VADAVAVTTIQDGEKDLVVQLTSLSDGTGEADVVKIDASALGTDSNGNACDGVAIQVIWGQVNGFNSGVILKNAADTDTVAIPLDQGRTFHDFSSVGGLRQYGTNTTGDITLSTIGGGSSATSGDSYMILIHATKHYA
jgi:hypothetical protein